VLVELRSNNDYTNDHYIPYPSKVRGLGSLIILTIKIITTMTEKELENNGIDLPKFEMPEYEEYVEEDNINDIEDEDISDEQYDIFEEKMEDVFIDINNIFSNVNDIEHNINYDFPNKFELKEEIFSLLKEIEEKTDTLLEKIYKLVYYMK
jgi:hypothetical protein